MRGAYPGVGEWELPSDTRIHIMRNVVPPQVSKYELPVYMRWRKNNAKVDSDCLVELERLMCVIQRGNL